MAKEDNDFICKMLRTDTAFVENEAFSQYLNVRP